MQFFSEMHFSIASLIGLHTGLRKGSVFGVIHSWTKVLISLESLKFPSGGPMAVPQPVERVLHLLLMSMDHTRWHVRGAGRRVSLAGRV